MPGRLQFLHGQMQIPPLPDVDLTGKTVIVTGANSGLGLDAAKLLVQLNCSIVVIATRSFEKGEKAKQEILNSVPFDRRHQLKQTSIVIMELELTSFASVVAFSEQCKNLARIDSIILNAGVHLHEFTLAEGYETTITVNLISTFLLATLLIPLMRNSAITYNMTPTISIVGSAVHFWADSKQLTSPAPGKILEHLSDESKTDMKARYFLSKLPVMLAVEYLANKLSASAYQHPDSRPLVILNNAAPGYCNTGLQRSIGGPPPAMRALMRSSEHGARTLVHGGTAAGPETHGQYLSECVVKPPSAFVRSDEGRVTGEKVWKELAAIYERVQPGCTMEL